MIVTDLDGTLLRDDKTVSERTKSVLDQCRKAGIKVVYATARGGSARRLLSSELFDGRVVTNGAIAYIGDDAVYNRLIPWQTARPLLLAYDRRGLRTTSQLNGVHYSNYDETETMAYQQVDFFQHDLDAEKLNIYVERPDDVTYIEEHLPDDLHLYVSRDGLAMVMHREATKSKAVAELARIWSISSSEIVAFGDDLNDIDMLSYVGIGVAMGNALDKVKAVADCMCLGNEEDGVAEWIAKNVLGLV